MCIYVITNTQNGKQYVGQTINKAYRRWSAHKSAKSGAGRSAIKKAVLKYGKNSFSFEVVDAAKTKEELNAKERLWVEKLNTIAPNGYNLETGGAKGYTLSKETRKLMSKKAIERVRRAGITPVAERPPKMTIAERAELSRQRMIGNTYRRGSKQSKESIDKMKSKQFGNKYHNTPVKRSDGVVFESVNAAAQELGVVRTSISRVLSGLRTSIKGYGFTYLDRKRG